MNSDKKFNKKRRDLFKRAIITTSITFGVPSIANGRLFGKPNSAIEGTISSRKKLLRLSMSGNDVPVELWKTLESLSDFWEIVSENPDSYQALRDEVIKNDTNISNFFEGSEFDTEAHRILLKISDPILLKYTRDGDHVSLLDELNRRGLLELGDDLTSQYVNALKKDRERLNKLKEEFSKIYSYSLEPDSEYLLSDIDFFNSSIAHTSALNVRNNAVAAVVVAVVAAVIVTVGVALTVAAGGLVVVSIQVSGGGGGGCGHCHGNLSVSKKLKKDTETVVMLANKTNNPDIAKKAIYVLHCREAAATLSAAESLGLITIDVADRKEVYRRLYSVIRKGLEA